jgi:hypothetical protein
MLLVLILWLLLFIIFFINGFLLVRLINTIRNDKPVANMNFEEYFFLGFLTLSVLTGIFSIFVPVGNTFLYAVIFLTLVVFLLNYNSVISEFKRTLSIFNGFTRPEILVLSFILFFVLTAVVQHITWLDTLSYHAQNIQWIRKYAVVPGLGNLHDRFAFNSMFFVISALFTFNLKDALVFPLNGICYIVLIIKLFSLYSIEINQNVWKAVFYMLLVLISLLTLIPNLNTPSPDTICAILTIYVFIKIFDRANSNTQLDFNRFLLLNLLIFTCVSYKISSLFLSGAILFFMDRDFIKRSISVIGAAILIIVPFLIRNYYLSGYLIYPFPDIDLFNVDWKIPYANVLETKSVIEGWARIPVLSYKEVLDMKFTEWIFPWFKQLNLYSSLLMTVNLISVISFFIMLFRKDFLLASIQCLILINLTFWFVEAPDPRFAYGFIFTGFALTIAYFIKLFEKSKFALNSKYSRFVLVSFLMIIIGKRIMFPVGTLKEPSLWIIPASFGKVEVEDFSTNFHYKIPVDNQECFYTEIPCVTYKLNNVSLRGDDLGDGFKVVEAIK